MQPFSNFQYHFPWKLPIWSANNRTWFLCLTRSSNPLLERRSLIISSVFTKSPPSPLLSSVCVPESRLRLQVGRSNSFSEYSGSTCTGGRAWSRRGGGSVLFLSLMHLHEKLVNNLIEHHHAGHDSTAEKEKGSHTEGEYDNFCGWNFWLAFRSKIQVSIEIASG